MTGLLPVAEPARARAAAIGLVREDPRGFAGTLVLNGSATLVGLAGPYLLGRIIDDVQTGTTTDTIDRLAAAILGCALLQILLTRHAGRVGMRFGERAAARVRERFLDRVLALPASIVERVSTGDIAARATGDVATVTTTLRGAAPDLLIGALQAGFLLIAVLVVNPLLGLCGLVGLLGVPVALRWYLRRVRPVYLRLGEANSMLADVLVTTATGARTIEALGLRQRRMRAVDDAIERCRTHNLRGLRLRTVLYPSLDVSAVLPLVGVLLVGGALYDDALISLGAVVTCAMYLRQLAAPLETLQIWLDQVQSSGVSFARLEGLARFRPRTTTDPPAPEDNRIEVTGVHYAYDEDRDVLHGVDLSVRPGERLAVVGPSGAGKSTLGRLLAGIDAPGTGSVTIGGIDVTDLSPDVLRRQIVLVTQEHHVFHDSLRTNLSIARPTATDDELHAALVAVGADWAAELPAGLDTPLGGNHYRLDAARAQQLALARVVLADPHTLILDEATAMLDPTTARATERALAAVLTGRTVLAIAHRLHTAHDADRVAVLDDGKLAEIGTHAELLDNDGTYADLWHSWHGEH